MNVICVDDEKLLADYVAEQCRMLPEVEQAWSFSQPAKALEWLSGNHADLATFGNFELFVDGRPITFKQAKCKELLAYLVDRRGSGVARAEAFAILWEDRLYDRPMQKQLDVIIRSLRDTLKEAGADIPGRR